MEKNSDGYYVASNACFLLRYHLVLVTKYRHPVIEGELEEDLYGFVRDYFEKSDCVLKELNGEEDHIHIMFSAPPTLELAAFVNNLKTVTSRRIRSAWPARLSKWYWKPYFWSRSYFVATVGETTEAVVKAYLQNQKRHSPPTKSES